MASEKDAFALTLLTRAHSPGTSSQIYRDKIQNRPLLLRPSSPDPKDDARSKRQKARLAKAAANRKSRKPKPLSAKEKRRLGVYELAKAERKYEIYVPVWRMWCGYMREILGIKEGEQRLIAPQGAGPMLASAEFVGARVEVVRCRCVGRVGIKGIVVKDTKFCFEIVTERNEVKVVPKEHTIFRFEVPLEDNQDGEDTNDKPKRRPLMFELHGSQFENRPADRANRKFKQHIDPEL